MNWERDINALISVDIHLRLFQRLWSDEWSVVISRQYVIILPVLSLQTFVRVIRSWNLHWCRATISHVANLTGCGESARRPIVGGIAESRAFPRRRAISRRGARGR